jgi:hypothetical protein
MKFLKLYEQFTKEVLKKPELELSDTTIDDVLSPEFFNDEKTAYIDSKGVIHIKNWNLY